MSLICTMHNKAQLIRSEHALESIRIIVPAVRQEVVNRYRTRRVCRIQQPLHVDEILLRELLSAEKPYRQILPCSQKVGQDTEVGQMIVHTRGIHTVDIGMPIKEVRHIAVIQLAAADHFLLITPECRFIQHPQAFTSVAG